jgi:Lar family restriction alleviation protein
MKPCPFCGCKKIKTGSGSFGQLHKKPVISLYFFDCMKCKVQIAIWAETLKKAKEKWNNRKESNGRRS